MHRFMSGVFVTLALLSAHALAESAKEIAIIMPSAGPQSRTPADIGDVSVTWENGRSEMLTKDAHAELPRLGPNGLIGWTWAKELYKELWVNEHLRIQFGKQLLFEVKSEKPFIEEWNFIHEGVAVKSRALHGPAIIELFSVEDGKRIASSKAYGEIPAWAKPFADPD